MLKGAPEPNTLSMSKIKSNLLHLAQTSVYVVKLQPPQTVQNFLQNRGIFYGNDGENIELLCSETNLPGSTLATHETTGDYYGVTEKFAYRRIYDETIDFTFYVDKSYGVIEFLDGWMNFVTAQGDLFPTEEYASPYSFYRMNYPNTYKTDYNNGGGLYITKFEKSAGTEENPRTIAMKYQFIGAFPISIVSMPVSYEESNILKCTASFSYIRYIRTREYASSFSDVITGPGGRPEPTAGANDLPGNPTSTLPTA